MNIKVPIPDKDYRVLVRCETYNQSKYICDALNGFAIQETDFPFICIVVDDASKDGNQEVIRQYANDNCDMSNAYVYDDDISVYIRVSHKTNTNCVYLFCFLKVNLYCKQEKQEIYKPYRAVCEFEAICEGDDYWIDPLKLQKQVDFLEENEDYVMTHTAFNYLIEYESGVIKDSHSSTDKIINILRNDSENIIDYILDDNTYRIQTATVVYRIDTLNEINKERLIDKEPVFLMGDTPLWVRLCLKGKIHFFVEETTIYRQHHGSACHQINIKDKRRFDLSCSEMRIYFALKLNNNKLLLSKFIGEYKNRLLMYKIHDRNYVSNVDIGDAFFYSLSNNRLYLIVYNLYVNLKQKVVRGLLGR